jgi:hypothetical protein
MIAIYCPTLGRPSKLQRVVDNIRSATTVEHRIVFVTEPYDAASFDAARATGATVYVNEGSPSYSNSLQTAYENDDAPFFIGANDDFDFQPGWDVEALKVMAEPGVQVVGVNDGAPNCRFTTISVVDRTYIHVHSGVIGMHNRVNYPYLHNYVDTEFHATAVHRGVFAAAPLSRVHHKHPDWGYAVQDDTYRKSAATAPQDAVTFQQRRHLWTS